MEMKGAPLTGRKAVLGLALGGLLAASTLGLSGLSTQALAAGSTTDAMETGGLVFSVENPEGVPQTLISNVNPTTGIVTINGGAANIVVTQEEVGTAGLATAVQIGNTSAFSGTITFNDVELTGAADGSMGALQIDGAYNTTDNEGATIILTGGSKFTTTQSGAQTAKGAINMACGDPYTLSIEGGSTVSGTNVPGIIVTDSGTNSDEPVVIQFDNGGGTVMGGSNSTPGNITGAIQLADTGNGYTAIQSNANGTVTGAPSASINSVDYNAGAGIDVNNGYLSFVGDAVLTVNGGAGAPINASSCTTPAAGMDIAAATEVYVYGPGTVNVNGGEAANINGAGIGTSQTGGAGINVAASASNELNVDGGTLIVTGGTGSDTNQSSGNQNGGPGINLVGDAVASTLNVSSGTLTVYGGAGGSYKQAASTQYGPGGLGIVNGSASSGENAVINMQQGDADEPAPVVTVVGGVGGDPSAPTSMKYTQAIGTIVTINISDPIQGSASKYGYWKWIATSREAVNGVLSDTQNLEGFDGMDDPTDVIVNLEGTDDAWVQVTTAAVTDIDAGVQQYNGDAAPYVVAQTNWAGGTMTGVIPGSSRVYQATLSATFNGMENLDATNFDELLGYSAKSPAVISPEGMTSTSNVPANSNGFYVVPNATGNEITIGLSESDSNLVGVLGRSKQFVKMYPNLNVVGTGTVPVVYTVKVTNGENGQTTPDIAAGLPENATLTATQATTGQSLNVYTAPDGSGNLVYFNTNGGLNDIETDLIDNNEALETIIDAAQPAYPGGNADDYSGNPWFIGLFNETGDPYTQQNNTQVADWNGNASFVAEWANVTLSGVAPTPTTLEQGAATEVNASYQIIPLNQDIESYSVEDAGIDYQWQALFVNLNTGSAPANGLSVSVTGSTVTGENPFFATIHASVTASLTADLGHYRVFPTVGNVINYSSNAVGNKFKYAVIEVVAGSGETPEGEVNVIRLHNPDNGEHLYTIDPNEALTLENQFGWQNEDIAWVAPEKSGTPIYRLYNSNNGDHMYTTSSNEYRTLQTLGWTGEGVKMFSATLGNAPVYRLFNPYITANGGAYAHLWTGDFNEYVTLEDLGWDGESVAWYAISVPNPE